MEQIFIKLPSVLYTPGAGCCEYALHQRKEKEIIGTCFEHGPIFRHFEFYDYLINSAKLRYYTTLETYLLVSFKVKVKF